MSATNSARLIAGGLALVLASAAALAGAPGQAGESPLPQPGAPAATAPKATAVPTGGAATGEASGAKDPVAAELLEINQRIALLSARLKEVELQASLAAKRRDLSQDPGDKGFSQELPVVRGIDGVGKHLRATLAWSGAITMTAGEGDSLPGGWRLARLTPDSVLLSRGTKTVRLGFGNAPPALPASQGDMPYGTTPARPAAAIR